MSQILKARLASESARANRLSKTDGVRASISAVLTLAMLACGAEDTTCLDDDNPSSPCDEPSSEPGFGRSVPLRERLDALTSDASLGSRGPDVQTLHEYLTEVGYFPNEVLSRRFHAWRPIVERAPAQADVFDEQTVLAVSELQRRSGIEVTGRVDEPTRALLRSPSCSMPDGKFHLDPTEKFALQGSTRLPDRVISWRIGSVSGADIDIDGDRPCTGECRISALRVAATIAFNAWSAETSLTFFEVLEPTTPDLHIYFDDLSGAELDVFAQAAYPSDAPPHDLILDNTEAWSTAPLTPNDRTDLQNVLMHEIGHTLGLNHSSFPNQIMSHNRVRVNGLSFLSLDDTVAISTLYDTWVGTGAPAVDIGVGGDGADAGTAPDVWIVGTEPQPAGLVYKWNGSTFQLASGNRGASRIAVSPAGVPWIISGGHVYERTTSLVNSGSWVRRGPTSNCATDIAAHIQGEAWQVGCTPASGGFMISKYSPASGAWAPMNGHAVRIAVEYQGTAWVTTSSNTIYRNPSQTSGDWDLVAGGGTDIGAGPVTNTSMGYVFLLGSSRGDVYVWNEQDADGPLTPSVNQFQPYGGRGKSIAVGIDGEPWIVARDNTVWRTAK